MGHCMGVLMRYLVEMYLFEMLLYFKVRANEDVIFTC